MNTSMMLLDGKNPSMKIDDSELGKMQHGNKLDSMAQSVSDESDSDSGAPDKEITD